MIITALIFFAGGAVICSVANGFGLLLVGRSLQGIGGGGLIALTEIVITDLIPMRFRGEWFGIISAMWSIGSVTGPIVGGAFAQKVSWVCILDAVEGGRILIGGHSDGSSISISRSSA